MKKLISILLIILLSINLIGCNKDSAAEIDVDNMEFDEILKAAEGTTVNFYGWGGSQTINEWLDNYVAVNLKEKYNVTLNRVPMNIDEILNKLLGEKQLNAEGTIDVMWINGENFYTAKTSNLLHGPFVDKLENFNKYVNGNSVEMKYDFGYPIEGYEAPYGKAQFVLIGDESKIELPKDHKELLEFAKKNPGKFTYPAPPEFNGSAFIRNIIYDIVGYEKFIEMEPDMEIVYEAIKPALEYLKEIKPYLWNEGKTYPATSAQLDNLYSDNEVLITMNYSPNHVSAKINTGEFPESSKGFIFDKGTIGNSHFLAIPFNSPNKAGAMALINYMLSVEAQASKYEPSNWGDLPVLDNNKLSDDEKSVFDNVKLGKGCIPQDELLSKRYPEMPAKLIPIIEELWKEFISVDGK